MEGSSQCLKYPATGPYSEPDESSPHHATIFPKIHSNIISPSMHRSCELRSGLGLQFVGK